MRIKFLLALIVVSFASGCAFTVHDLPVNYQYSGPPLVVEGDKFPSVEINEIKDVRNVANPRMIMNQKNGYGQTTTGGWQAEKAISEIVKDALVQGVDKAGLSEVKAKRVKINGELVDVSSSVVSGWVSGTINMKVTVKLSAFDELTNKILWKDTVFGDGTSGKQTSSKPAILKAFKSALDDMVNKMLEDEYFKQQLAQ